MREFPLNKDKVRHGLIYFLKEFPNASKTQIMKFLFLADFYAYKEREYPIFGGVYIHMPRGPVPVEIHKKILGELISTGLICEDNNHYQVPDDIQPDITVFTIEELDIIHKTINFIKRLKTAWNVSEFTHTLSLWQLTENGEPIPYEFAAMSNEEIEEYIDRKRFYKQLANNIKSEEIPDEYWDDYEVSIPIELQEEMINKALD